MCTCQLLDLAGPTSWQDHTAGRIVITSDSTVEVHPVDQPNAKSIRVALDCDKICPNEIPDVI